MQSCNTPCTGTEYPIHMGTVPLKEEEEEIIKLPYKNPAISFL